MRVVEVAVTDRWTDEFFPTVPRSASAREAALAILHCMEWDLLAEQFDDDPLVFHGTCSWLRDVAHLTRTTNRLIAWLTSRMKVVHMCMTEGHEDDDGTRYFNDCWAGDPDDDPCSWEPWWTIDATGSEFWRFAQGVARS